MVDLNNAMVSHTAMGDLVVWDLFSWLCLGILGADEWSSPGFAQAALNTRPWFCGGIKGSFSDIVYVRWVMVSCLP